jgi:hypothetical protein
MVFFGSPAPAKYQYRYSTMWEADDVLAGDDVNNRVQPTEEDKANILKVRQAVVEVSSEFWSRALFFDT